MPYSTAADVAKRLRRALTPTETANVAGAVEDADGLIDAYLGVEVPLSPVPSRVVLVSSRMVGRVFAQDAQGPTPIGVQQTGVTAGPFAQQTTFTTGTNTGNPWLTAADKIMLKAYRVAGRAFTIDTAPLTTVHEDDES